MQRLVDGIHRFQNESFSEEQQLFETLAKGQSPLALFITCSDSRIVPSLITQTKPGELFILRTAGNIVPPYGAVQGGEAATIEYAVDALGVSDIIVCGHSHCGAMTGLLHRDKVRTMPAVDAYLNHAEATARIVSKNYSGLSDDKTLEVCIAENVLVQLENAKTHPSVASALSAGKLKLHGWIYTFESGKIHAYDPDPGEFVELDRERPMAGGNTRMLSQMA